MNQPLYTLQINTIATGFEIKINDVPLYSDWTGKPTQVEFPINHLLFDGNNIVNVAIAPRKPEISYSQYTETEFSIYQREINSLRINRHQISVIDFPDYKGDEKFRSSIIPVIENFNAAIDFDNSWSKCLEIKLDDFIVEQARTIYHTYFNALLQKDIEKILELTEIKDKSFSASYYNSIENHRTRMKESLLEIFDEPEYNLVALERQTIMPSLHGFSKLITILNKDSRSPLQFYNREENITKSFPIYLGMFNSKMNIVL